MPKQYLDPRNDLAFRKIFGTEKHKGIPIHFLNAALELEGKERIVDLEFLNTKQLPEIERRKESIVDVLVRDQAGTRYIVEMQVAKVEGFEKRAQYYAAKTYCSQFNAGEQYNNLKKIIFLAITNYIVFPEKKDRYKSMHVVLDNDTFENDLKDFSFTFVELPKFNKTLKELVTIEDKWYYFLKHATESDGMEEIIANHPEIKEAYEVLDSYYWTEQEMQWYEDSILHTADQMGVVEAAKKEGREEGREEGQKRAKIEIAKNLLQLGLLVSKVSEATGLSKDEIETFQNKEVE